MNSYHSSLYIESMPYIPRNNQRINRPFYYNDIYNGYQSENINPENSINSNSLEYLLSIPQITDSLEDNQEENKSKFSLLDFIKDNLNNLKEDLIYYFSSPESLSHFRSSLDEEIRYKFYKDLDSENFIISQKGRFKQILSNIKSNSYSQMKISKLSNFNDSFCIKTSLIQNNNEINNKIKNANLIGIKMDECSYLYSEQVIDDDKLINYINELKDIFAKNKIDMESLGLTHFNFIEKNLISILRLTENKLVKRKNTKNLTSFSILCLEILTNFNSTKLYFYIIRLLKQYRDNLDNTQLNLKKESIQFIPNNFFNFSILNNKIQNVLINDLVKPFIEKGIINNDSNNTILNLFDYKTLNYENYLLLFLDCQEELNNNENNYFYYKIDLINKTIIDAKRIEILNKEDKKNVIGIIDINISLRN